MQYFIPQFMFSKRKWNDMKQLLRTKYIELIDNIYYYVNTTRKSALEKQNLIQLILGGKHVI